MNFIVVIITMSLSGTIAEILMYTTVVGAPTGCDFIQISPKSMVSEN